jgi:hypothetical protein
VQNTTGPKQFPERIEDDSSTSKATTAAATPAKSNYLIVRLSSAKFKHIQLFYLNQSNKCSSRHSRAK